MSDIFRRFFGFHNSFPENWSPDNDNDEFNEEDPFQSLFSEQHEMFRHFERHFEQVFKNFGFMEFNIPPQVFNLPEEDVVPGLPESNNGSLRDQFLKRSDSGSNPSALIPYPTEPLEKDHNNWFRRWFEGSKQNMQDYQMKDRDLDNEVSDQGLNALLKDSSSEYKQQENVEPVLDHSYFSSSSMTIKGADGKIEKRYSKRDSFGNEETSVTRKYGDRIHTIISRRDRNGKEEHEENFVNLDENSKEKFDHEWSRVDKSPDSLVQIPSSSSSTVGIFTKMIKDLFG